MTEPKRIPTNLITGFLGTGKTSAIQHLLQTRPTDERWSIFVNEYGQVAIDQTMFEQRGPEVQVRELAGGCLCCTMAFVMDPVLAQFIRLSKPDRLLIEPSGAGHPANLLDKLRSNYFAKILDLRATICLVDPEHYADPRVKESAVFHDQIQMADVVVLNWTDRRSPDLVNECRRWIESFDPPKLLVTTTSFGKLDPKWLDLDATVIRPPRFGDAHQHEHELAAEQHAHEHEPQPVEETPEPGRPVRIENEGQGRWACGWIFSAQDIFNRQQLLELLVNVYPILRLKGVFHCQDGWWHLNRVADETTYSRSSYRRDSRLEILLDYKTPGWPEFEQKLLGCLAGEDT